MASDDLAALLDWYGHMGVDEAILDAPVDRFRAAPPPVRPADAARGAAHATRPVPGARRPPPAGLTARPPSPAPSRPQARFAPSAPDEAVMAARAEADGAGDLAALEAALARFEGCALKATARNLCFYRGAPKARLMLIGEAPGRDEDLQGKPFVGRAGQLLDRMLAAIDLGEADVHITNIVYWRPPGNRTPTPQEALACRPFLERQIALVAPEIVLLLGGAAAKQIFDTRDGIMRLRGKWRTLEMGGRRLRAMATLHPAYLLRTPIAKRHAWRDLLAVRAALDAGAQEG